MRKPRQQDGRNSRRNPPRRARSIRRTYRTSRPRNRSASRSRACGDRTRRRNRTDCARRRGIRRGGATACASNGRCVLISRGVRQRAHGRVADLLEMREYIAEPLARRQRLGRRAAAGRRCTASTSCRTSDTSRRTRRRAAAASAAPTRTPRPGSPSASGSRRGHVARPPRTCRSLAHLRTALPLRRMPSTGRPSRRRATARTTASRSTLTEPAAYPVADPVVAGALRRELKRERVRARRIP